MKAQLLTAFGSAENFELSTVPTPVPARGQVLVRISAVGINSLERMIRSGRLEGMFPTPLPAVLGKEVAGTVEALGPGTAGLTVGDRVAGFADSGAYAEYCVARTEALAVLPDGVSFETAATLPVAVETATRGISALGVRPGWTVVVNGASGAVGGAAVQLLAARGAMVIGTASGENHPYVTSLGAVPVRYGDGVEARIRGLAPRGVDAVYDAAGHGFAATAVRLTGDPQRVLTVAGFEAASLGVRTSTGSRTPNAEPVASVLPLVAAGVFRTRIDSSFPLADLASAHTHGEQGRPRGKILVAVPS